MGFTKLSVPRLESRLILLHSFYSYFMLVANRFMLGMFEAGLFPGMAY